jgi:hypothetical protein
VDGSVKAEWCLSELRSSLCVAVKRGNFSIYAALVATKIDIPDKLLTDREYLTSIDIVSDILWVRFPLFACLCFISWWRGVTTWCFLCDLKAHYSSEMLLLLFLKYFFSFGQLLHYPKSYSLSTYLNYIFHLLLFGSKYSNSELVFCKEVKILLYIFYFYDRLFYMFLYFLQETSIKHSLKPVFKHNKIYVCPFLRSKKLFVS